MTPVDESIFISEPEMEKAIVSPSTSVAVTVPMLV
jgi:hypothetical protein